MSTMQQPRFANRTSKDISWQQTVVLHNANNQEEAFSIGPDGRVWSFISGRGTDTSRQRLESLGLEADFLAVGRTDTGALVVIASKGLQTSYRTEAPLNAVGMPPDPDSRWTPARSIPVPPIQGATGVRRLYTQSDFSGMRIAMIVDTEQPGVGSSYVMACSQWHESGPGPFILLPPLGTPAAGQASKPAGPSGLPLFRVAHSV